MTTVATAPQLLGRESDLLAIADAIESICAGEGSVLVIEGPAGIGKTSLVAEARRLARTSRVRTLSARGGELEREFAFGVIRQLFEPALNAAAESERSEWLTGTAALAAPLFDPATLGRFPGDPGFQRRHGLYWLAANIAGSSDRGLMLLVDDLHWADSASLEFLGFLARRLGELPLGLLVAGRPSRDGFGGLAIDPAARVLRPAPLTAAEVATMVARALPGAADDAFSEACRNATGGVPFLIGELLREIAVEGIAPRAEQAARVAALSPRNIATAVALRLARLPESATALAQATAVLGDGAPLAVAGQLANITDEDARAAAQMLVEADVLAAEEPLRFVHPIVRTAIYDGTAAAERPPAHARAAVALRASGAAEEAISAQLQLAAPVGESWAVEVLRRAAERAQSLGAPDVAAANLRRALDEVHDDAEREQLLFDLALAESDAGSTDADRYLVEATALARSARRRAEIAVERSRLLRLQGRGVEALAVVDQADAALAGGDPELSELLEIERLASATMSTEVLRELVPLHARLPDSGEPPASDADRFRLGLLALDTAQRGTSAETVIDLALRAVTARPPGVAATQLSSHATAMAAIALSLADRYEQALALTSGLVDLTERLGLLAVAASLLAQRAQIQHRRGALVDAEADATRALALGREVRAAAALTTRAGGVLTFVAIERGTAPDPELMAAATATESTATRSLAYSSAEHLLAQGQFAAAATALLAIGEFERELGWTGPAQYPWRSQAALALDQLGERDQARVLAAEELELARAYGAPRPIGIALRACGRLAPRSERLAHLEEAVAVLSRSGAELEHARSLVELGSALRVAGRRTAARDQLGRGYELATECGASRLAEHAWQELLAAGARPRRKELKGVASLTPSERRIVELAATGHTNREIAQTLFVTAKTVETHLGHAYTKLGVGSRVELEAALSR